MTETAADRARREREAQGLPPVVGDTLALARLARLVRTAQLRNTNTPVIASQERAA